MSIDRLIRVDRLISIDRLMSIDRLITVQIDGLSLAFRAIAAASFHLKLPSFMPAAVKAISRGERAEQNREERSDP